MNIKIYEEKFNKLTKKELIELYKKLGLKVDAKESKKQMVIRLAILKNWR